MSTNLIFSEGRSNAYLVHGVGVLVLTGILMIWSMWAIFLFPFSIPLFLSTSGVEVDPVNKQVRRYIEWSGFRKGIWLPLNHFSGLSLEESLVLFQHNSITRYQRSTSRTFDICLTKPDGELFQLNDFFNYNQAVACGNALAEIMQVEFENNYGKKTKEMKLMRKRR